MGERPCLSQPRARVWVRVRRARGARRGTEGRGEGGTGGREGEAYPSAERISSSPPQRHEAHRVADLRCLQQQRGQQRGQDWREGHIFRQHRNAALAVAIEATRHGGAIAPDQDGVIEPGGHVRIAHTFRQRRNAALAGAH